MNWHVVGDWGTSRLRLFRIEDDGVVDRLDGPGIGALKDTPESHLRQLLDEWRDYGRPDHILLCGMAGSRNGLAEAPYAPCPVDLADWKAARLRLDLGDVPLRIAAGISSGGEDVMRGEETQIFGALAREPALEEGRQLVLLPGTHSKWAWVENGRITSFRTWFTGELFALLSTQSTLLKASGGMGSETEKDVGWQDGLARARQGRGLGGSVFEARAAQLLRGKSANWAEGFLSGLLIGSEIEEACGQADLPDRITIIGAPALAARYAAALSEQGLAVHRLDGDDCVLAGLELLNDLD